MIPAEPALTDLGTRWRWSLLALALLCVACGRGKTKQQAKDKPSDAGARFDSAAPSPIPPVPRAPSAFKDGGDEAKALADLGALPAWSTILERYRLLARRDQSGLAVGLLVEHEGGLRLVDTREGQGSLSIPVRLPELVKLSPPARVVLWGAWHNSADKTFVWKATRVETLAPSSSAPEFAPGLRGRDKAAPELVQLAGSADRRGGVIAFTVHQRQERMGDGWLISDGPGLPPVARLLLPGERAPYGDQSRVTESERWQLQSSESYWLEIGRFRPASQGALPVYRARTPPFRFSAGKSENSP